MITFFESSNVHSLVAIFHLDKRMEFILLSSIIRYSSNCTQYSDFQYRASLLGQKPLKQGYVNPILTSLPHNLNGWLQELVNLYDIPIYQMKTESFPLRQISFSLSPARFSPVIEKSGCVL